MSAEHVLTMLNEHEVKFVDLRFTDTKGKEQHVTIPAHQVNAEFFEEGKMFDGSSIGGWKGINESDMVLMPDASTALIDPFFEESTLIIRCDIHGTEAHCRVTTATRAPSQNALKNICVLPASQTPCCSGQSQNSSCSTTSVSAALFPVPTSLSMISKAHGTPPPNMKVVTKVIAPGVKGGYFPVPPVDSSQTSVLPCVWSWKRWALSLKRITTKWRLRARTKSLPALTL